MKTVKAKIKGTSAILEGCLCDDSFFVSVDHDTFERYDLDEIELCEPNPNSLTLEGAARLYAIPHYTKDIDVNHIEEYPYDSGLEAAFIAGAKWQAEKCDEETSKLLYAERQTAYINGWHDCKEQMPMPEDTLIFKKGVAEGRRLEREDIENEWLEDRGGCFWDGVNEGKKAMKDAAEEPFLPGSEEDKDMVVGRDYVPVDWVETLDLYGRWKIIPMKDAVEGEVENATFGIVYLRENLVNEGYSTGDKVRIVIIAKEED